MNPNLREEVRSELSEIAPGVSEERFSAAYERWLREATRIRERSRWAASIPGEPGVIRINARDGMDLLR